MVQPVHLESAAGCDPADDDDASCRVPTVLDDPACRVYEFGEGLPGPIPRPFRSPQFHYTSVDALDEIFSEGHIRTCPWVDEDRLPENDFHPTHELVCDVAWTSAHPVFEIAATSADCMSHGRNLAICDMLDGDPVPVARIEVDPAVLFGWSPYLYMTRVAEDRISYLAWRAEEVGSDPDDWAVCPRPIPCDYWLSVEIWDGDDWVPLTRCTAPASQALLGRLPANFAMAEREGLSAGGAWVRRMRQRGGADWYGFLVSGRIFRLKMRGHSKIHAPEFIQNLLTDVDMHPVYSVLMAIQCLPETDAAEVLKETAAEAIDSLNGNPAFARSVQGSCGLDLHALSAAIKRRYGRFGLKIPPVLGGDSPQLDKSEK